MARVRFLALFSFLLLPCVSVVPYASAQMAPFGEEHPAQSLALGLVLVDFSFDGDERPSFTYDYANPAYGLVYTRPNVLASLAFGRQSERSGREALRFFDLSLTTWAELYPFTRMRTGSTRIFVPIVLHSSYRRVAPRNDDVPLDDFNVTAVGLGAGIGGARHLSRTARLEARAHPVIALASSARVDALGSARLLDVDVQLHLGRRAGRFGMSLGYGFRAQVWNVEASDVFPEFTGDLFDYQGHQHLLRVGVNW